MHFQILLIVLFFLFNSDCSKAQDSSFQDSLEQLALVTTDSSKKAEIYFKIASQHQYDNIPKAIQYINKSLNYIPKKQTNIIGNHYNSIAVFLKRSSKYEDALKYLDTAMHYFEKTDYKKGFVKVYSNRSMVFGSSNRYAQSTEQAYLALNLAEELKDTLSIAHILSSILTINLILKEYRKALYNGLKALDYYQEMQHQVGVSSAVYNIGLIYGNMEKHDSSLLYLNRALDLFAKNNNIAYQAIAYDNIANIHNQQENYTLALENINNAIQIEENIHYKEHKLSLYLTKALSLSGLKKYEQSTELFKTILDSAQCINDLRGQRVALDGLIDNYIAIKNFEKAFEAKEQIEIVKDSILNTEKQQQIKDLEIKYETEKIEQENALLAKEKELEKLRANTNQNLLYLAIIAIAIILIISILLMQQYKTNATHLTNQLKHRLLRNQMSPHFIFNSLVAIQNFVYKKAPIKAGEYLASFAQLIRAILENSMEEYIPIEKEIQWLDNYLQLQLLRFDNSFNYTIDLDKSIDLENMLIPPMLTQPFIENAIEHGLKELDYKGEIRIKMSLRDEILHIEVRDNGVGLELANARKDEKKHQSLALKITKERLNFLNKKRGKNIFFNMKNLDSKGTLVSFSLPLNYKY